MTEIGVLSLTFCAGFTVFVLTLRWLQLTFRE
jgi:hypothetical protein